MYQLVAVTCSVRPGLSQIYIFPKGPGKWVPLGAHFTDVEIEAQVMVQSHLKVCMAALFTSTCVSIYSPMPTTQTSARRTLLLFRTTSCSCGEGVDE